MSILEHKQYIQMEVGMPIKSYSGIDWISFVVDLVVILFLSAVLAFPVQIIFQWFVATRWVDTVYYWQAFLGVLSLLGFVWYGLFKNYGKWEGLLKL